MSCAHEESLIRALGYAAGAMQNSLLGDAGYWTRAARAAIWLITDQTRLQRASVLVDAFDALVSRVQTRTQERVMPALTEAVAACQRAAECEALKRATEDVL